MSSSQPYGIIYLAFCEVSEKGYVGQTTQGLQSRWAGHTSPNSGCRVLRLALLKYGASSFTLSVLDTASDQAGLDAKEIKWIEASGTLVPAGYNLKAGGSGGGKASKEARQNMRSAQLGKKQTPETIEKRAAQLRGKKRPGVSKKLRESWQTRDRAVSDEVRVKQSAAHAGNKHSAETRRKMAEAQKSRRRKEAAQGVKPHFSGEAREVLRQAHLGTRHSAETRRKMSVAHRRRLATQRELGEG